MTLRILFADDFEPFRFAAREWMEEDGHYIHTVKSGREAARLVSHEPFDLLVTDLIMPDGDGLELIREVRKSLPTIKIVAISGGSEHLGPDYYVSVAKRLGANAVLMKPFEHQQFRDVLAGLFPAPNGEAVVT